MRAGFAPLVGPAARRLSTTDSSCPGAGRSMAVGEAWPVAHSAGMRRGAPATGRWVWQEHIACLKNRADATGAGMTRRATHSLARLLHAQGYKVFVRRHAPVRGRELLHRS